MIELISNDAKYWRKYFVTQSRRVHDGDAWPYVLLGNAPLMKVMLIILFCGHINEWLKAHSYTIHQKGISKN